MGEINLTEEITNHLIGRFEGTSTRWATEVAIFDPTNQNAYPVLEAIFKELLIDKRSVKDTYKYEVKTLFDFI